MNKNISTYLDMSRFVAALAVFLGHISGQRLTGGLFWQADFFMSQAVTMFFVLSGFVIAYVHDQKEKSAREYIISRMARLYSVAAPALILTFVLDTVGSHINPGYYNSDWGYNDSSQLFSYITSLFFLNQIWFLHPDPGSNLPYWSLGYEVWYYIIFGFIVFYRGPWRWLAMMGLLAFVGPKILSMFPIWLLGVATYYVCANIRVSRIIGTFLWIGTCLCWMAYEVWAWRHGRLTSDAFDIVRRKELPEDYLISLIFSINLIGFYAFSKKTGEFSGIIQKTIHWCAGATFSLYLYHLPIGQFLASITPWSPASGQARIIVFCGTMIFVFSLAAITERRKNIWRKIIARLWYQPPSRQLPCPEGRSL